MSVASVWAGQMTTAKALEPPRFNGEPNAVILTARVTDEGNLRLRLMLGGKLGEAVVEIPAAEALACGAWITATFT